MTIGIRREGRWWWHARMYDLDYEVVVDAYGAFRWSALWRARREWRKRQKEKQWENRAWEFVQ